MLANSHKFRAIKHGFGTAAGTHDSYYLKLDGVQWDFNHPGLDIEGGEAKRQTPTSFITDFDRENEIFKVTTHMKNLPLSWDKQTAGDTFSTSAVLNCPWIARNEKSTLVKSCANLQ